MTTNDPRWPYSLFGDVRLQLRCPHIHMSWKGSDPEIEPTYVTIHCNQCHHEITMLYDELNDVLQIDPVRGMRELARRLDEGVTVEPDRSPQ